MNLLKVAVLTVLLGIVHPSFAQEETVATPPQGEAAPVPDTQSKQEFNQDIDDFEKKMEKDVPPTKAKPAVATKKAAQAEAPPKKATVKAKTAAAKKSAKKPAKATKNAKKKPTKAKPKKAKPKPSHDQ